MSAGSVDLNALCTGGPTACKDFALKRIQFLRNPMLFCLGTLGHSVDFESTSVKIGTSFQNNILLSVLLKIMLR